MKTPTLSFDQATTDLSAFLRREGHAAQIIWAHQPIRVRDGKLYAYVGSPADRESEARARFAERIYQRGVVLDAIPTAQGAVCSVLAPESDKDAESLLVSSGKVRLSIAADAPAVTLIKSRLQWMLLSASASARKPY